MPGERSPTESSREAIVTGDRRVPLRPLLQQSLATVNDDPPSEPDADDPPVDDTIDDAAIDRALVEAALAVRERAYVPYSGFRMGAAVRTRHGAIVTGTLVENVSLGLAMCAERVALFTAVASGERPLALAVAAPRTSGAVTFPCGACLQVALELGGPDVAVFAVTPDGDIEASAVGDLLPCGPHKQ